MKRLFRLGLIINPIAGMGGRVGLHGTDGDSLEKACTRGAIQISPERARRALRYLQDIRDGIELYAADGEMGFSMARELGFAVSKVEMPHPFGVFPGGLGVTSAADTRESARALMDMGVDLILFAGGDGTARDIHSVVGELVPLLGIPTGVKMRSGVFATNPASAGELARGFILRRDSYPVRDVEILDQSEISDREDWPPLALFGQAKAPYSRKLLQSSKSSSLARDEVGISTLCESLATNLRDDALYFYGPGTTTKKILAAVGEKGVAMGVDASLGKKLIGLDLAEAQILDLLDKYEAATLFLGVIGGQGFLLGRGNQQISGNVINQLKVQNIVLLASAEKIGSLSPSVLQVDLGDPVAESALEGYRRVHVAPGRSVMCKVITPQSVEGNRVAV